MRRFFADHDACSTGALAIEQVHRYYHYQQYGHYAGNQQEQGTADRLRGTDHSNFRLLIGLGCRWISG